MATKTAAPAKKLLKVPTSKASADLEDTKAAPAEATGSTVLKAKPKAKPATAVAEADDMIVNTAHEVMNLKSEKAIEMVPRLLDLIDHDYFKLGGVLAAIQSNGWFQDKGHETFRAFVEAECGLQYRKSMYLIQIYNGLVNSGVPWSMVKGVGWTKLKELANILNKDNAAMWVEIASSMTVLQLQQKIKEATAGESAEDSPETDTEVPDITTKTFKLHADQKATVNDALEKARHVAKTEVDSVALEFICIDFLGGSAKAKSAPSLAKMLAKVSLEEALEAFSEAFPDVSLEVTVPEEEGQDA